jgi:hypothetical protein
MEDVRETEVKDLRVFYMTNGQILFADLIDVNDEDDYVVCGPVQVQLGQAPKQIGMSMAFPFSDQTLPIRLNWRLVTTQTSLDWNPSLIREYGNFWLAVQKKADHEASGIEVVPANAVPPNLRRGLGTEKKPMGPRPNMPPLKAV